MNIHPSEHVNLTVTAHAGSDPSLQSRREQKDGFSLENDVAVIFASEGSQMGTTSSLSFPFDSE